MEEREGLTRRGEAGRVPPVGGGGERLGKPVGRGRPKSAPNGDSALARGLPHQPA